jgi:squalene-associated FAD-dependent desaturase
MGVPCVHIVGAGLAGLAAGVRLVGTGRHIVLHEAAGQAGGRCRSYFDTALGLTLDNGNHLLLSGNSAARAFLRRIGAEDALEGPAHADFAFVDLATKERWRLRPNDGPFPWWIFIAGRRVPGTRWRDYLALAGLLAPGPDRPLSAVVAPRGRLWERLWQPFFLAALNTDPTEGSTKLAGAILRETLAKGGRACRPLVAKRGLSAAFIDPALHFLAEQGATLRLGHRLCALELQSDRAVALAFQDASVGLGPDDAIILAAPPVEAANLLPGLEVPQSFRAIVNAHFKIGAPAGTPPIQGVVNGLVEWLFAFEDRVSVTISGADALLDVPREALAERIWADVAAVLEIAKPLPPWQIIKEKRATFAATPLENARRPGARTGLANVVLAGDWTATGLPATIEGAIRSGVRAADVIRHAHPVDTR